MAGLRAPLSAFWSGTAVRLDRALALERADISFILPVVPASIPRQVGLANQMWVTTGDV